jgi:hypothetical protein
MKPEATARERVRKYNRRVEAEGKLWGEIVVVVVVVYLTTLFQQLSLYSVDF